MNREIKFRVWTGFKMEYNIMAGFLGAFYVQGMDEKDAACMSPFNTKYYPETPVMQFTGLLDKTGKEIYEGDIIKAGEDKMLLRWSEVYASFVLRKEGWAFSHFFGEACSPEDCEIIGNIHENPELL